MDIRKIKRRDFVKGMAVATIGAPMIVPSTVFGQNAPSNRLTTGQIGVGNMGTTNMKEFLKRDDVQVLAICDLDQKRAEVGKKTVEDAYAQKSSSGTYKGCDLIHDFRDIIARKDIDFISIAVPDHWHAIPAITTANAGKDLYAEKPLALTIPQGRAMCDAVARNKIIWQTGSWQRSEKNFHDACELVRNGRIGKVHTVYVGLPTGTPLTDPAPEMPVPEGFDYNFWLGPAPFAPYTTNRCHWNFRWILDYSGGQLTDWAAHHVDIANWGMGTEHTGPVEVEGKGEFPRDGLWNASTSYYIRCSYAEGFTMIVMNDKAEVDGKPLRNGVKFVGDKGWLWVARGGEIASQPENVISSIIDTNEMHLYRSNNHYANFIECVRARKETIAPIEHAQRAVSVAHLGNISMLLGRKIKFNPKKEQIVGDQEAERMLDRAMRSPWHL
jgi:predicted dehydrogenase